MNPTKLSAEIFFVGPTDSEECRTLIERALGCPLRLLEGEKYEDALPYYEAKVLGFEVLLSAQETIWPEGRCYQLSALPEGRLRIPFTVKADMGFHFATLLKSQNISLIFDTEEFAAEYRRREQLQSS